MITVGINGFGRIGKCVFLQLLNHSGFQIKCINAITITIKDVEDYIRYDSNHRYPNDFDFEIIDDTTFRVNHHFVTLISEMDAKKIKWRNYDCNYVIEATGCYLTTDKCKAHNVDIVVISAPPKDDTKTFIYGVNENTYRGETIISGSSCTTNCLAPMLRLLNDTYRVKDCVFTTIHAATATQFVVDIVHKTARTNRSIFNNIIPHTTGASASVTCVLPELIGKVNGTSVRVPVSDGSLVDLNIELEDKNVTLSDICKILKDHQLYKKVYDVSQKKLVSSDFLTTTTPTILDVDASIDMGKGRFKLMIWYDNEWSYSAQLIRLIESIDNYNFFSDV
jgi:glyceraldehyde 3-phosphate dehydrogenase